MDQCVGKVGVNEFARRSSQVAIVVGVPLELVVGEREHTEAADIKLALIVEGWPLYVLLNDKCLLAVVFALAQDALDLSQCRTDADSIAAV